MTYKINYDLVTMKTCHELARLPILELKSSQLPRYCQARKKHDEKAVQKPFFHFCFPYFSLLGYSQKIPTGGLRTHNTWNIFPGLQVFMLKKEHVEIPGGQLIKKVEFPGEFKRKNRGISRHGSWFLTLEFPRGVIQFLRIFRGENLFSLKF